MADYTHKNLTEVEDAAPGFGFGDMGEVRFAKDALDAERTGISHLKLNPGVRMPFAHKHDEAEEIYVVIAGSGLMKMDDEIVEIVELDAIRISPPVARSFEAGPDGITLLAVGARHDGDGEVLKRLVDRLMGVEVHGVEGMKGIVGKELGPSAPLTVTQELIDGFADVSGDHQWIHVDPQRSESESPYGKTIAHGNLTLSLADGFRKELMETDGFALGLNYGWNKVRFPAPVPVGSEIVGTTELVSFDQLDGGWWQAVTKFTITVAGAEKPSFVGESVTRMMAPPA